MFGFSKKCSSFSLKRIQNVLNDVSDDDIELIGNTLLQLDEKQDRVLTKKYYVSKDAKRALVAYIKVSNEIELGVEDFTFLAAIAESTGVRTELEEKEKKIRYELQSLKLLSEMLRPMFWDIFYYDNKENDLPESLGVRKGFQIVEHINDNVSEPDHVEEVTAHPLIVASKSMMQGKHAGGGKSGWTKPIINPDNDDN